MGVTADRGGADEYQLFQRARAGPDGFVELYDKYFRNVYDFVYYRTRNHTVAEDVVSETFFAALRSLPRYEWRGRPLRSWLLRIAANEVATYYRKHRELPLSGGPADRADAEQSGSADPGDVRQPWENSDSISPEAETVRRLEYEAALASLASLPTDQQEALILRYVNDLDAGEIAVILERSEGAVRALISRGLKGLRQRLAAEGGTA